MYGVSQTTDIGLCSRVDHQGVSQWGVQEESGKYSDESGEESPPRHSESSGAPEE